MSARLSYMDMWEYNSKWPYTAASLTCSNAHLRAIHPRRSNYCWDSFWNSINARILKESNAFLHTGKFLYLVCSKLCYVDSSQRTAWMGCRIRLRWRFSPFSTKDWRPTKIIWYSRLTGVTPTLFCWDVRSVRRVLLILPCALRASIEWRARVPHKLYRHWWIQWGTRRWL